MVRRAKVWVAAHFFLHRFDAVDSLRDVSPRSPLSALSRPELEALLAGQFGEVAALKQVVADCAKKLLA